MVPFAAATWHSKETGRENKLKKMSPSSSTAVPLLLCIMRTPLRLKILCAPHPPKKTKKNLPHHIPTPHPQKTTQQKKQPIKKKETCAQTLSFIDTLHKTERACVCLHVCIGGLKEGGMPCAHKKTRC